MHFYICTKNVRTSVLYEYMNSLRNDVCNLFVNTHVRNKMYREFYHCVIYIANEGRHVRIIDKVDIVTFIHLHVLSI